MTGLGLPLKKLGILIACKSRVVMRSLIACFPWSEETVCSPSPGAGKPAMLGASSPSVRTNLVLLSRETSTPYTAAGWLQGGLLVGGLSSNHKAALTGAQAQLGPRQAVTCTATLGVLLCQIART